MCREGSEGGREGDGVEEGGRGGKGVFRLMDGTGKVGRGGQREGKREGERVQVDGGDRKAGRTGGSAWRREEGRESEEREEGE